MINNKLRAKIEVGNYDQIPATIHVAFAIGEVVTGFLSTATAEVVEVANIGDNYIKVKSVIGIFEDTEGLSGSISGAATSTGILLSEGVKSYQQRIPAIITTLFLVDEIISGLTSTAFAKVAIQANPGDTYIVIKQRTRQFESQEDLVGSIAGIATSNGSMTTGDELYTNPNYGMLNGLWTLETTGNMIESIEDSVMRINIDSGGNLGTGYQFGFNVANFGLVSSIDDDGLFLKHLPVRYYIDFGAGYTQVWSGIIDTFPKSGDLTADFKCTDSNKANIEKIGSDLVPITLNRNYNCKLSKNNEEIIKTSYINKVSNGINIYNNYVYEIDQTTNKIVIIGGDTGNYATGALDDFDNGYIEVTMGDGAGSLFKVYKAEERFDNDKYDFWVNEDVSPLKALIGSGSSNNISIIRVVSYSNQYNLSGKDVLLIHNELGSKTRKPLTIYDNDLEFGILWPDNYIPSIAIGGALQIDTKAIDSGSNMELFSKIPLSIASEDYTISDGATNSKNIKSTYFISKDQLLLIDEQSINGSPVFLDFGVLKMENFFSAPPTTAFLASVDYKVRGYYDSNILQNATVDIMTSGANNFNFISMVEVSGNDLIISYTEDFVKNFGAYELLSYSDSSVLSKFEIELFINVTSDTLQDPTDYIISDFGFRYGGNISTDNLSIGCNGENVFGESYEVATYPETFEYIQENYIIIPSAKINDASYLQAEEDYNLFPSVTERNPSHQIIAQTDSNTILKDMLRASHLGMFENRVGEYTLENWLPKSTVFSDTATVADYNATDWLKSGGIGEIGRSQITQVISDFQLDYDFSEATGEYLQTMRIKNTSASVFDFATCTEGVSADNEEIAAQAWELLRAGYLRAKKESQSTFETKWIKMSFSDGTGESEAINYIRNQAGHLNRELEKVTIKLPLNATDAIINLLSFVSVTDQKRTNGEVRPGWIIDHRISWKSKQIIFRILLDISQFDPFLVQINIIQDDATETEIIQNDSSAIDIIQDGTGK